MVGPKCGSCTVTGGWARPARQGWATPAPACFSRPAASPPFSCPITLYCLPFPSSIFPLLSQSGCFSFHLGLFFSLSSFLPGSHPSPSLFLCLSLSPGSPLSLSFFLPPSLAHSSLPLIPTLPGPLLAASLGPLSFCVPPLGRLAVLGRPRWCFSLGSAVQLLPGKGQLAGPGGREVPSWGVPLAGPSRLSEYRGVRLWSEPSVHTLRQEAGSQEEEEPRQRAGLTL